MHDATLETAMATCSAEGARLCSVEEIQGACTAGTGCGHDADMIWTSGVCDNGDVSCGQGLYFEAYSVGAGNLVELLSDASYPTIEDH